LFSSQKIYSHLMGNQWTYPIFSWLIDYVCFDWLAQWSGYQLIYPTLDVHFVHLKIINHHLEWWDVIHAQVEKFISNLHVIEVDYDHEDLSPLCSLPKRDKFYKLDLIIILWNMAYSRLEKKNHFSNELAFHELYKRGLLDEHIINKLKVCHLILLLINHGDHLTILLLVWHYQHLKSGSIYNYLSDHLIGAPNIDNIVIQDASIAEISRIVIENLLLHENNGTWDLIKNLGGPGIFFGKI
ncbi:hypothetical protein ACJX0J_041084, partial [Zea mays]